MCRCGREGCGRVERGNRGRMEPRELASDPFPVAPDFLPGDDPAARPRRAAMFYRGQSIQRPLRESTIRTPFRRGAAICQSTVPEMVVEMFPFLLVILIVIVAETGGSESVGLASHRLKPND